MKHEYPERENNIYQWSMNVLKGRITYTNKHGCPQREDNIYHWSMDVLNGRMTEDFDGRRHLSMEYMHNTGLSVLNWTLFNHLHLLSRTSIFIIEVWPGCTNTHWEVTNSSYKSQSWLWMFRLPSLSLRSDLEDGGTVAELARVMTQSIYGGRKLFIGCLISLKLDSSDGQWSGELSSDGCF